MSIVSFTSCVACYGQTMLFIYFQWQGKCVTCEKVPKEFQDGSSLSTFGMNGQCFYS